MKISLIFDLDGTLWDARVPIYEAWNIVGKKYFGPSYFTSLDDVGNMMGKTMDEIGKLLTPPGAKKEISAKFVTECFACENDYLSMKPGFLFEKELEILIELSKKYDLYIVSNCQSGYIECFLPLVPSDIFKGHMCWDDTRLDKNFTILELMRRYSIKSAIYIGDTQKDEAATRLAGIPFIHAAYGFGTASSPDAVATRFDLLPNAIDSVVKSLE